MILVTLYRFVRDLCIDVARLRRDLAKRYPDAFRE